MRLRTEQWRLNTMKQIECALWRTAIGWVTAIAFFSITRGAHIETVHFCWYAVVLWFLLHCDCQRTANWGFPWGQCLSRLDQCMEHARIGAMVLITFVVIVNCWPIRNFFFFVEWNYAADIEIVFYAAVHFEFTNISSIDLNMRLWEIHTFWMIIANSLDAHSSHKHRKACRTERSIENKWCVSL